MNFHIENAMQVVLIVVCACFGIKVAGKLIKFLLFIVVIIVAIYFLFDSGIIDVPI